MIALAICVVWVSSLAFVGWVLYLRNQPACSAEEFQRVVKQLNTLTEAMAQVQQTADSMRTAVGMIRGVGTGR